MTLNRAIFIIVVGLSSCADQQFSESERNISKLKCEGLSTAQREECLSQIPPEYNKYEEERQKLLKERIRTK